MKGIWVLTSEYNQYDQYGEYFVDAWLSKPTPRQLTKAGVPKGIVAHVLAGGGRIEWENQWWHLKEI